MPRKQASHYTLCVNVLAFHTSYVSSQGKLFDYSAHEWAWLESIASSWQLKSGCFEAHIAAGVSLQHSSSLESISRGFDERRLSICICACLGRCIGDRLLAVQVYYTVLYHQICIYGFTCKNNNKVITVHSIDGLIMNNTRILYCVWRPATVRDKYVSRIVVCLLTGAWMKLPRVPKISV